jgi:hypothetical protein
MTLWLKAEGYSVEDINIYSTGVQGTAIAIGIIATNLVMVYPVWAIFSVIAATLLFCNICLLVWNIPLGLHCKFPSILLSPGQRASHTDDSKLLSITSWAARPPSRPSCSRGSTSS